jgi:Predicted membrane protein (DUF2207)
MVPGRPARSCAVPGLAATSSSDGFSLPALIGAAVVAVAWLAATAAVWTARRPPDVDAAPATMDLGPEPPAIASLLCDDYEVRTEVAPATLLDLAARDVITLDELRPGETICRVRPTPEVVAGLAPFERHVLSALQAKAIDGVIPTAALTTGTEAASKRWHRDLAKLVVVDAQQRGLTEDRWPKRPVQIVSAGAFVVVMLIVLSTWIGGDAKDHPVPAGIAVALAIGGALLLAGVAGKMRSSLAQRPTPAGSAAEASWLGVRAHLAQNEQLQELPPAAVKLYGRHLAYAAGFGLAEHAIAALPFGEEDDHLAWSAQGGRWRRVRVRYPRVRPPAWGRHPALATAIALVVGAVSTFLLIELARHEGRIGVLLAAALTLPLLWSVVVLVTAVPDLLTTRRVTGTVIRCRVRPRYLTDPNQPKLSYYVAIDDGSRDRIKAYRVPASRYDSVHQGQSVVADVSLRLGYVWNLR